jgi:hypothetical protein
MMVYGEQNLFYFERAPPKADSIDQIEDMIIDLNSDQ